MKNISETAKKMMLMSMAFSLLAFIIGIFALGSTSKILPYALGIALGVTFAVLKVVLLERTVKKTVDLDSKTATDLARLNYFFRYLLTGAVLAFAATNKSFSLLGTIIGIMSLQAAAYTIGFMQNKKGGEK